MDEKVEIALVQLRTETQTQELLYDAFDGKNDRLASIIRRAKTTRLRNDEKAVRRKVAAKNNCKGPREAIPNWGTWRCHVRFKGREKTHPLYATKEEELPEDWWNQQGRKEWMRKNKRRTSPEEDNSSPEMYRNRKTSYQSHQNK